MTDTNPPPPEDQPPAPPAAAPPAYPQQPPAAPGYPAQPPAAPGYPQQPPAAPGAPGYGQPPGAYGYAPVPVDRLGRPLAEWWQRLLALFIDGVILSIPYYIVLIAVVGAAVGTGHSTSLIGFFFVGLVFAVVELGYFALLTGSAKGQTVGMMALGIAVRDADAGGAIDPVRAGKRIIVLFPGIVIYVIPVLGFFLGALAGLWSIVCGLSPLWNPGRKGYHDIVAKTDVIKVR